MITYGVLDLLGELGGLVKLWGLTIGAVGGFLATKLFEKKLKDQSMYQTSSLNNIKRVSDAVDSLEVDSIVNKDRMTDIENQLNETREAEIAKYDRITKLE